MTNSPYSHFIGVCREQVANFQQAIELMESDRMGTAELRNGARVDTTQETIADYRRYIAELEPLIAKMEAEGA